MFSESSTVALQLLCCLGKKARGTLKNNLFDKVKPFHVLMVSVSGNGIRGKDLQNTSPPSSRKERVETGHRNNAADGATALSSPLRT